MKKFHIDDKMREILDDISPDFPYVVHRDETKNFLGGYVPWHWHGEIEFTYVVEGTLEAGYKEKTILLNPGDGAFTNSNTLHAMGKSGEDVVFYSQIIQKSFLGGKPGSAWESRYLLPVIENKGFEYCIFRKENKEDAEILDRLRVTSLCGEEKAWGYEFELRNSLSQVWLALCKRNHLEDAEKWKRRNAEDERIKKMMRFIQEEYANPLRAEDIARAADVSTRECFRCFSKNLSMTPFHYLMQHRVMEAAESLRQSDDSITKIGLECGFLSNSYFTKIFKEQMGCTPSEYRRMRRT